MTLEEAYGDQWETYKDFVDKHGWISLYVKDWGDNRIYSKMDIEHRGMMWRVDKLRGQPGPVLYGDFTF